MNYESYINYRLDEVDYGDEIHFQVGDFVKDIFSFQYDDIYNHEVGKVIKIIDTKNSPGYYSRALKTGKYNYKIEFINSKRIEEFWPGRLVAIMKKPKYLNE